MTVFDETPLSLTDWVVLGLVAEGSRHGFAIARELEPDTTLGRVWTVRRPLVYRSVERLVSLELIAPTHSEPGTQGPPRTLLEATPRGQTMFGRWLQSPVSHPRDVRTDLMAKFVFLARRGVPLGPLARRQLESFAPAAAGILRAATDATGPDWVVATARLETMRSITRTLQRFTTDRLDAVASEQADVAASSSQIQT
jgi:DNA-binding PadR family transcriptional regulator